MFLQHCSYFFIFLFEKCFFIFIYKSKVFGDETIRKCKITHNQISANFFKQVVQKLKLL